VSRVELRGAALPPSRPSPRERGKEWRRRAWSCVLLRCPHPGLPPSTGEGEQACSWNSAPGGASGFPLPPFTGEGRDGGRPVAMSSTTKRDSSPTIPNRQSPPRPITPPSPHRNSTRSRNLSPYARRLAALPSKFREGAGAVPRRRRGNDAARQIRSGVMRHAMLGVRVVGTTPGLWHRGCDRRDSSTAAAAARFHPKPIEEPSP
jgi:hypothetical protein